MKEKFLITVSLIFLPYITHAQLVNWERTPGPGGGLLERVEAFSDGVVFVAESDAAMYGTNRVFRSNDTGRTWSQVTAVFQNSPAQSFAEMSGLIFAEERSGRIFLSANQGRTWKQTKGQGVIGYDGPYLVPKQDTLFGIVNDAGIFRSIDRSDSWQNVTSNLPRKPKYYLDSSGHVIYIDTVLRFLICLTAGRSAILVGTDTGVYRSINGGQMWKRANEGLVDSIVKVMVANGDTVFAATKTGIYRSTDAGIHWSLSTLNQALFIRVNNKMVSALMSDNSYWISTDAGDHWMKQSTNISSRGITCIGLVGSINLVSTLGQGILRSDDSAKTWYLSNAYLGLIRPARIGIHDHTLFVSGQQCGLLRSSDRGETWSQYLNIGNINCFFEGSKYFFAADDQELYNSSDTGSTWHTNSTWNGPPHERIEAIGSIGTELFAGAEMGWFVSEDSGSSWAKRGGHCGSGGDVWSAVFSADTIWDETDCGIGMSIDGARTWDGVFFPGWSTINPKGGQDEVYLYAGFGEKFVIGTDQHTLNQNLQLGSCSIYLCTNKRIFAATPFGVYETKDNGENWQPDTVGMGAMRVYDIVADADTLYAATDFGVYHGLYSNLLNASSSTYLKSFLVSTPNPFSQSTSIKFTSSDRGFAQVSIHNLLGSEVARLFSGSLDGGEHSFTWDAHGMPPGMYICVIGISGRTEELPVMLVK